MKPQKLSLGLLSTLYSLELHSTTESDALHLTNRREGELDFCKNVVHIPTTKVVYNLCKQNCHFMLSGFESVTN